MENYRHHSDIGLVKYIIPKIIEYFNETHDINANINHILSYLEIQNLTNDQLKNSSNKVSSFMNGEDIETSTQNTTPTKRGRKKEGPQCVRIKGTKNKRRCVGIVDEQGNSEFGFCKACLKLQCVQKIIKEKKEEKTQIPKATLSKDNSSDHYTLNSDSLNSDSNEVKNSQNHDENIHNPELIIFTMTDDDGEDIDLKDEDGNYFFSDRTYGYIVQATQQGNTYVNHIVVGGQFIKNDEGEIGIDILSEEQLKAISDYLNYCEKNDIEPIYTISKDLLTQSNLQNKDQEDEEEEQVEVQQDEQEQDQEQEDEEDEQDEEEQQNEEQVEVQQDE
jgi:hypothetical protein